MNIAYFLLPKNRVAYLYDDYTFRQGLEKMRHHGYTAIPVISRDGKYVGTVSEGDFLWRLLSDEQDSQRACSMKDLEQLCVRDILRETQYLPVRITVSMEELLSSAANLGAWDLLGGGVLADCLKHSRLDEAQSCIHALQVQLGRFEQELADVKLSGGIMLEVGGFLRFADIFVDDIFSGAMVLGRIRDARGQVSSVAQQLHGTMQTLCRLKAESLHRLGALQEERTQLLLQTEREQAG